jgi:phospholipid-binding lipoprotein MlaA
VKVSGILNWVGCVLIGASLSACAGGPTVSGPTPEYLAAAGKGDEKAAVSDPNEQFNRSVFENNQKFNHDVLYPVAKAYNDNVSEDVRDRIESFTTNLSEPVVFANNVLQLRPDAAFKTLGRFAINSTVGLGGLFDVAATEGITHQSGDFGQTLYVWGYRDSAYVVLPVIGPTTVRDAIGTTVEFAAQLPAGALVPTRIASLANTVNVAGTVASPLTNISKAEDMQTLEESSIDFYSMLRSVTQQKRQAELQEALDTSALTGTPPVPDPDAIEPVMTLVSSPMMLEKPKRLDAAKVANKVEHGTIVMIGPPTPVEERSPAEEVSPAEERSPAEELSPAEEDAARAPAAAH